MALDLTLCLVPKQIETLFSKAASNSNYAEWMQFIPSLYKNPDYEDYQDEDLIQLKEDVAALGNIYQFTDDHYFYDTSRCSSTIDYLINEHARAAALSIQPSFLWKGGNEFPNATSTQGMSIRLYDKKHIENISLLLISLEFNDLLVYYNYEKMQDAGVYKLTHPKNLEVLELAFYEIQDIFLLALAEDLLVFKVVD